MGWTQVSVGSLALAQILMWWVIWVAHRRIDELEQDE